MNSFINREIKIVNQELKKNYHNLIKKEGCFGIFYGLLLSGIIIDFITPNSFTMLIFWIIVFSLFVVLFFNIKFLFGYHAHLTKQINQRLFRDIIEDITKSYVLYEENTMLAVEDFNKLNIFNLDILNYSGKNFTASSYLETRFIMSDVLLYDLRERIKTDEYYDSIENINYIINYHYQEEIDIFKGIYLETTFYREHENYIYLVPNNLKDIFVRKSLNHYLKYQGKRIELENLDFNKNYQVYSVNQIKSRLVLSLKLMERISEIDKILPYKKYFVFKDDGRVGIYIDKYSIEKIITKKRPFLRKVDKKYLKDFYKEISHLLLIIKIMNEK